MCIFLQTIFCVLHYPFKPHLKPRKKKKSGRKITYFFTKSIRFRVQNINTIKGGGFLAGEGNFNTKGYKKKYFFNTYTSTGWVALDIFNNVIYYIKNGFILIVFVETFFCIAFMFTFKMRNAGVLLRY